MASARVTSTRGTVTLTIYDPSAVNANLSPTEAYNLATWLDAMFAYCVPDDGNIIQDADVAEFFEAAPVNRTKYDLSVPLPENVGCMVNAVVNAPGLSMITLAVVGRRRQSAAITLDLGDAMNISRGLHAAAVAASIPPAPVGSWE
jgi:hypothetical protein